jgi:hypothetical protein
MSSDAVGRGFVSWGHRWRPGARVCRKCLDDHWK